MYAEAGVDSSPCPFTSKSYPGNSKGQDKEENSTCQDNASNRSISGDRVEEEKIQPGEEGEYMEKKEALSVMVSIVQGQLNEVYGWLSEDWRKGYKRDNEGNSGIEEKIDGGGGGDRRKGGYNKRVESSTHAVEAD